MSRCCVVSCENTSYNTNCAFYKFPQAYWKMDQRTKWIEAVRKINTGTDEAQWNPRNHDHICSAHFVGGKKTTVLKSPSYIPTIFAPVGSKSSLRRMKLLKKRLNAASKSGNTDTFEPYYFTRLGNNPSGARRKRKRKSENKQDSSNSPVYFSESSDDEDLYTSVSEYSEASEDELTPPESPDLQEPHKPLAPEEVNCCKDCAVITYGFPFWCVECGRGPLCASCAECAPHDSHFLLRTPRGAPRSQTEAVLEVIRQQLQAENLLELYEVNVDCVKVEIKEEPQELPLEFDDPDSQDPLDSDTGEQVVADETNNQTLTKRRRIMPTENNAIQPKTLVKLLPVSDSSTGSKTNLKPTAIGLKNILLTPVASGSQPEETTPDGHNSQNAASSKKRKSQTQTILNMIPSDQLNTIQQETPKIRETQTVIKNPTDKDPQTKNQPGKLRIKRTLLKVPLSEFTKSTTLNPSSFKALSNVELSDIRKSQSIKKTLSDQLKSLPQSNDIKEAQTVLKSPTDIKDPQSNSQPEKLKIKRTFLKVPLSELTQSKILNPGGSKTLRKLEPGDILNLEQVQKLLKRPDVEQSDHEGQKLKKVLKGFSTPLKVTSESSRRSK
ncbi:uncharacterized protein LOC125237470 [Leguminivora glycinivorella]|uniref:uncharacterized protein LOC125237470 n=1 Tax=Leguminivora glycinivorella TaxID=1035111 RepID=UPI0020104928|nr:uncharacterized protein LOC125237470 [Leguminivora glycinivorella]